jgi:hypothetical protein
VLRMMLGKMKHRSPSSRGRPRAPSTRLAEYATQKAPDSDSSLIMTLGQKIRRTGSDPTANRDKAASNC